MQRIECPPPPRVSVILSTHVSQEKLFALLVVYRGSRKGRGPRGGQWGRPRGRPRGDQVGGRGGDHGGGRGEGGQWEAIGCCEQSLVHHVIVTTQWRHRLHTEKMKHSSHGSMLPKYGAALFLLQIKHDTCFYRNAFKMKTYVLQGNACIIVVYSFVYMFTCIITRITD